MKHPQAGTQASIRNSIYSICGCIINVSTLCNLLRWNSWICSNYCYNCEL